MPLRRMRHSERTAACLIHISGVLPIWGALCMGGLLWRFRGRSRPVVFHAMQGIFFHLGFLLVETPALLLVGLGRGIALLRPELGAWVVTIGWYLVYAIFAVNCVICLIGANAVIDGRDFDYPFFGRRIRPPFEEAPPIRRKREFHTYMTPIPPAEEFVTPIPKAKIAEEAGADGAGGGADVPTAPEAKSLPADAEGEADQGESDEEAEYDENDENDEDEHVERPATDPALGEAEPADPTPAAPHVKRRRGRKRR